MNKIINIQEPHPSNQNGELITLKGITTSRVEQALKGSKTHGQSPYPARVFLKVENQEQDIPVFFRIKETPTYEGFIKSRTGKYINYSKCYSTSRGSKCTYEYAEQCGECSDKFKAEFKNCENWIKPKIKPGSYLEVKGDWAWTDNYQRLSFTATSFKLLACSDSLAKPYYCLVNCPCEKDRSYRILAQSQARLPNLKQQAERISQRVKELSHE